MAGVDNFHEKTRKFGYLQGSSAGEGAKCILQGVKMNRGLLTIHSCPMALMRHVEWTIESVLGDVQVDWRNQPLLPGSHRAVVEWRANRELSATLASKLKSWHYLRFEINECNNLFRYTPDLGLHRITIDEMGNMLLTEHQIRHALATSDDHMRDELNVALGTEWEGELEPYRGVDLRAQLRAI